MFAWNNSVLPPNEAPKSPTAVRVKTPPTVEMIDPTNEEGEKNEGVEKTDDKNILDDVQAEKKQKTSDSSEDLNQDTVEKTESNENEETTEQETKLESETAVYDNPLLVHVS